MEILGIKTRLNCKLSTHVKETSKEKYRSTNTLTTLAAAITTTKLDKILQQQLNNCMYVSGVKLLYLPPQVQLSKNNVKTTKTST